MGNGLKFAFLAAMIGKRNGAQYGNERVTISAVGFKDGQRFVMATSGDGTVILGKPDDFAILKRGRKLKAAALRASSAETGTVK